MAGGHGGKRTPRHPAPVSGPGRLSRRTDGKSPAEMVGNDGSYGSRKDMQSVQSGADMTPEQASAPTPALGGGPGPAAPRDLVPLDAQTQNPDEPITAGVPVGAGVGPEAAGIQTNMMAADMESLRGLIPSLEIMANQPGSNPSTRAFVRFLKAQS